MRPLARALAVTLLVLLAACAPPAPPPAPAATVAPTAAAAAPTGAGLAAPATAAAASATPVETATAAPPLTPTPAPLLPDPTATPPLPAELIDETTAGRLAPLRGVGLGGANGAAFTRGGEALVVGTTAGLAWLRLPGLSPVRLDPVGGAYEVALSPDDALLAHGVEMSDGAERTALRRAADASLIAELDGRTPVFGPDGAALVTSSLPYSAEQRAWLWRADGAPVAELAGGAPVWSPDGRFVATVETPYEAPATTRLYDADGGLLLELAATAPAFSPDGAQLAVTGAGQIELYGLADADLRASVPVEGDAVSAFSADGARLLIVAGPDLIAWDLAADSELERFPAVNRSAELGLVEGLIFAPGAGALASLAPLLGDCPPGGVRVTATDDGRTLYEDDASYQAVFSGDGAQIALNPGSLVRVASLAGGAPVEIALPAYEAVAFSPEGATMALSTVVGDGSGRTVGQVELWDVITSERRAVLTANPDDFVFSLSELRYSPDGARLSALARYGCAAIGFNKLITWELASGQIVSEIGDIPPALDAGAITDSPPRVFAFAADGSAAAWVDEEEQRLVLRRPNGAEAPFATEELPTALAFSPDGVLLAIGDAAGSIYQFGVSSGEAEPLSIDLSDQPDPSVRQLMYSTDGELLLARTDGGRVVAVDRAGGETRELQLEADQEILGLSADKRYLIASDTGGVLFCDLGGGGCAGRVGGETSDAALGPGRRLIAAVQGGRVVLWGVR